MFKLGIVILVILSLAGLELFVSSANPCSIFNKTTQCNSDIMK